jgi:hypothetical protein
MHASQNLFGNIFSANLKKNKIRKQDSNIQGAIQCVFCIIKLIKTRMGRERDFEYGG